METATQLLHRLSSYETGRDWDSDWSVPVRDPRVLEDLEVNDLERFPWFFKRYPKTLLSRGLPRDLEATPGEALGVLAGTASEVCSADRWEAVAMAGTVSAPDANWAATICNW